MTAPVFVAPTSVLSRASPGGTVLLDGPEGRHAASVRRLRPGEPVDLVDGEGLRAHGVVQQVLAADALQIEVRDSGYEPSAQPRVAVLLALIKGDRFEDAVQMLTELGVDEIVPWAAARSVVQWRGEKSARAVERVRSTATEAGKQSRRARFPLVSPLLSTDQAVARMATADGAVVLHESAQEPLTGRPLPREGEIWVVVGPEGGIDDAELRAFAAAGARPARLGGTVLRTATAAVSGAALVLAQCGRLAR